MARFLALVGRFGRDERGVFAVIFGLMAVVLIALSGAVVDYVALEQARSRSQIALDAAALALQPEIYSTTLTDDNLGKMAEALVRDRIDDSRIEVEVKSVRTVKEEGSIFLSAHLTVPTSFVGLVGVNSLSATVSSQAVRGSLDLEISVALDVTGSMAGSKIKDLRASVADLIKAVVQDVQDPNKSRMALVPYSQAFNAGTYATALRGPIRGPKAISDISWTTGATKAISGATQANPVVLTAKANGFPDKAWVYVWNISGMSQVSGVYQIKTRDQDKFDLIGLDGKNVDGSKFTKYSSGGSVVQCTYAKCALQVTSKNHGYKNDEYVHVTDVGGLTAINNTTFQVSNVATNTLMLNGTFSGSVGNYVANTGQLHCTWQNATEGCSYFRFQSPSGNWNTFAASNCITERATNGTNDLPPTTTLAGRNYPAVSNNPCLVNTIVPLTSNKTDLLAAASKLTEGGSTAGALGILGAWYMLSPNFGYAWPEANRPEPYGQKELLKAAIIMTDGEFNTVHCNGVVAKNSTSGSGNATDQNNCTAPNGDPYVQARAYCNAMKAARIIVYTVAFDIASNSQASQMMRDCASSPENAFLAANGDQLRASFQQIARVLSTLRLTQ